MNDVDTLADWLTEVFATPEESGGVSLVGLVYKQAGGATELSLHAFTAKGGGAWGNTRMMAEAFFHVATRHCAGIASPGGAHQLMLLACFGTSTRPTRFLPFTIQASPLVSPGMMTESATPQGVLAQSMRLSEELVRGSFKQNSDNAGFAATMIDRSMRRQAELENDNRELFIALKLVIVEFQKSSHEMRMREIAAMRAAQFQKKMQDLLPVLVNMVAEGTLPDAVEEQSIADALATTYTKERAEKMLAGIASTPNGQLLAGALKKKLDRAYARQEADVEEDAKLLREVPLRSFAEAAQDAAGRAVQVIRDQAAPQQLENGKNGRAEGLSTGDAEKLRSLLFAAVPDAEQLAGLTEMLRLKGANDLADELERQFKKHGEK